MHPAHPLRLWRGVLWGWSISLLLVAMAGLRYALADTPLSAEQRGAIGVTFLVYLGVGAAVGLVAGVLGSYVRGKSRAALLGFLAAAVMYTGAASTGAPSAALLPRDSVLVLVLAALVGPLTGIWRYRQGGPDASPVSDSWP